MLRACRAASSVDLEEVRSSSVPDVPRSVGSTPPRSPLPSVPPPRSSESTPPESGRYVIAPSEQTRVLLALDGEDTSSLRLMLRRHLPVGARVQVAGDLHEASLALRASRYDVVIASVDRHGAGDAIASLAATAALCGAPQVIALGSDPSPEVAVEACRRGAQDYVVRDDADEIALARAVLCAKARAERTKRLLAAADVDELTGVANRRPLEEGFRERRSEALRADAGLAMLIVDLDDFKAINDAHGHLIGDRVLAMTAERIVANVRCADLVARVGGDEFGVLLGPIEAPALRELVRRLDAALSEPFVDGELTVPISASVGASLGRPDEITDVSILVRRADAEMYRRKRARAR
ncbi:MAG: diguanylate cyclase [Polyangiaceae bacterium]|nr:diguanylate cyclase [Polyangiaceae bacterium]